MQELNLQDRQQHEQATERLLISLRIQKTILFVPLLLHFNLFLWIALS